MNETLLILGMFIITFAIRFVMFAFAGKMTFPNWLGKALKFVPPAVLTAIIVPAVVMPEGNIDISFNNSYLIAALFALIIALISKSLLKTIGLGMIFFLVLRYFSV
ncbi:AzlD domain-containing protein [Psychromonas hadalis]|uniref:AzlD domain-containing protein n=1 Tax=Psychromonas hadalis TaxID=211669 RepID=UPI0003B6A316|nr:AzlD domain-containing protein [Psychromonas hadalis]